MWKKINAASSNQFLWSALIILMSMIGITVVLYSTVWGAALSDDSYYYISSARNLLAGRGFDLAANFPPVLSLLLSTIGIFGADPLNSIRWLNAILFALNIYLIARIVYTLTRSRIFSLVGAFFALISSTMIMDHSWAMSEPLFITFTLAGLLVYAIGYQKESWHIPLLTGVFWGLAAATRYIGVSLLFAGGIFWLLEKGRSFRLRLRNTFVFSIVGIFPLILWMVRNEILMGQPTNRVFALHLIPARSWITMLNTVLLWFIPGRFVNNKELFWLVGIIVVFCVWLLSNWLRNWRSVNHSVEPGSQSKPILFIGLNMLTYMFILIISRSFFDERIPMDERLLSPTLVLGLILLLWIFARQWKRNQRFVMGVIVVIGLAVLVTNLTRSFQMVQSYHESGRGYASARNHISETYAYLRNRPDIPVYSNAFAGIYFWTGRVTYSIPQPRDIPAMKLNMQQTGAYLVIFDSIPVELYGTTREELTQGLVEQIRLSEATIYRSP